MGSDGQKTRSKSCPICGKVFVAEPGSRRLVLNTTVSRHIKIAHHDYHRQVSRWDRRTEFYFYLGALALLYLFGGLCSRYSDHCGPPIIRSGIYSPFFPLVFGIFIVPIVGTISRRRVVRGRFRNEWQATHRVMSLGIVDSQKQTVVATTSAVPEEGQHLTEEERNIIKTVRDLSGRLGIIFPIHVVRWLHLRPSDACVFGLFDPDEIDLPRVLKGKLDSEELRPLIATSMIYELKLERRRALGLIARMLGSLSLLIFFVIFAAIALAGPSDLLSQVVAGILAVVFIIIPILLSQWLGARLRQRQRLEADRLASGIVGKESLLQTLRRIDGLGLHDIETLKRGGQKTRFAQEPNITRRIERLSGPD
ncbi:hypothetical protein E6H31_08725 [Candidatus Bathyarchaeota archaeon]|nr:MAG: hypothetical protein E6H31_08725 [Candidatus Bathyarchaeota archaeon]